MSFTCDLSGEVALVTGASSGFGRHFALTLAANGAAIAAAGRSRDRLSELVQEIESQGGRAVPVAMDVTDPESVRAGFEVAEIELGPVSVVVNNAGVATVHMVADATEADYDRILDTNAKGVFLVAQEAGKHMIKRGHKSGRIINVASISAFKAARQVSTYCMSKAAVTSLTRTLALEWAPYGINVNALCPGVIMTEMTQAFYNTPHGKDVIKRWPRQRISDPSSLDGVLLLLASPDASSFMTGSMIVVDDGQTL